MHAPISRLSETEQRELLDDLNYLNLKEFRAFCNQHSIPYTIWVETDAGEKKTTSDADRKSVVLGRIRHYLKSGIVLAETCFTADIVRRDGPPKVLRTSNRLYYGWYDKKNSAMIDLLQRLTDGEFKDGALARILAREFWTNKRPRFPNLPRLGYKPRKRGWGRILKRLGSLIEQKMKLARTGRPNANGKRRRSSRF